MIEDETQYEITKNKFQKLKEYIEDLKTFTWFEIVQMDGLQSLVDELQEEILDYENRNQTNSGSE